MFVNYLQTTSIEVIPKQISADIGSIIRTLCVRKGIDIIATAMSNHIHLYAATPPKCSTSEVMGYFMRKSSLTIFGCHAIIKYKYGNRCFRCQGYYVDTIARNEKAIREYVQNQLMEDFATN